MLKDGVGPCFNVHRKSAVLSSVHVGQSTPCSKLQSNGDCGAAVDRRVVVVIRVDEAVVMAGPDAFIGRDEQLLVENVKSSIEMSP